MPSSLSLLYQDGIIEKPDKFFYIFFLDNFFGTYCNNIFCAAFEKEDHIVEDNRLINSMIK